MLFNQLKILIIMKKVIVALAVFLCSFSYAQGSAKDMEPIPQALENFVGYKVASINSGKLSMTSVIDFQKALENRLKMDSNLSIPLMILKLV